MARRIKNKNPLWFNLDAPDRPFTQNLWTRQRIKLNFLERNSRSIGTKQKVKQSFQHFQASQNQRTWNSSDEHKFSFTERHSNFSYLILVSCSTLCEFNVQTFIDDFADNILKSSKIIYDNFSVRNEITILL